MLFIAHDVNIQRNIQLSDQIYPGRWGHVITSWPRVTVLVSVLVCGAFTGGMALWYQELDQEVLWTPCNSPVRSY